jgi:peptidoglycan/LPS O-acetylase OafA/YrhL
MNYGGFENIPIKHPTISIISSVILYALIIVLLYSIAISFNDRKHLIGIIVCSLGVYSFGIFLVHFFYQQLITILLIKMGIAFDNALFYLILFTGMLVLSYLTCYIISRFNFGRHILGFKPAGIIN